MLLVLSMIDFSFIVQIAIFAILIFLIWHFLWHSRESRFGDEVAIAAENHKSVWYLQQNIAVSQKRGCIHFVLKVIDQCFLSFIWQRENPYKWFEPVFLIAVVEPIWALKLYRTFDLCYTFSQILLIYKILSFHDSARKRLRLEKVVYLWIQNAILSSQDIQAKLALDKIKLLDFF